MCVCSLLRSAIAKRCHRPTESARAARQGPAARATDAERTRGTTTLRVRPVNSESRPRGRLPPDRLSSAPPVRPVRPVTCPADRAPPAAASRPAVPVALSLGSLGFPYRPGTQSLSSQPPATPSLFWGTGVQGVGQTLGKDEPLAVAGASGAGRAPAPAPPPNLSLAVRPPARDPAC